MAGTSATASSGQARRTLVVVGPADELRRCARAGAVLAGALANRARGAAEELLSGSRPAGWGGLGRAEDLADEGRQAAAEVLGTLRRELSGLLGHMEHLEQSLRGPRAADVGPPPEEGRGPAGSDGSNAPRASSRAGTTPPRTTPPRTTPAGSTGARTPRASSRAGTTPVGTTRARTTRASATGATANRASTSRSRPRPGAGGPRGS